MVDNLYRHFSKLWSLLGALNTRGRLTLRTPKGTIFWRSDQYRAYKVFFSNLLSYSSAPNTLVLVDEVLRRLQSVRGRRVEFKI